MISTAEFVEQLKTAYAYETAPEGGVTRGWDRLLGRTDAWYYWRMFGVVLRGGRLYRRGQWTRESWQDLSLDMWRAVEGCGGRMQAEGLEHLAALDGGPAVIVANHMSLLETFTIPALVLPFVHMTFVVKESLMRIPLFRQVMLGVDPLVVGRKNPREDMKVFAEQGPEVLASGKSIVVFPQSTRSAVFRPSQFNTVAVKLAKRAGVPVVPLALKTDFHGLGRKVKDFGKIDRTLPVRFAFGAPLAVEGNGRAAHEAVLSFIAGHYATWGGSVESKAEAASAGTTE